MSNTKYTFYIVGTDGLPLYPRETGDQMCPIKSFTINLIKAITWNKPEDFECLMAEYDNPIVVAITNGGDNETKTNR